MTAFDFALQLIISEATQNGLVGDNKSVTGAFIVIAPLIGLDILLSLFKQTSPMLARVLDGEVLIRDGQVRKHARRESRVDEDEILLAARERHGIGSMDQIRHAILEVDGTISVIPVG